MLLIMGERRSGKTLMARKMAKAMGANVLGAYKEEDTKALAAVSTYSSVKKGDRTPYVIDNLELFLRSLDINVVGCTVTPENLIKLKGVETIDQRALSYMVDEYAQANDNYCAALKVNEVLNESMNIVENEVEYLRRKVEEKDAAILEIGKHPFRYWFKLKLKKFKKGRR